jgi:hypothetical protein
LKQLENEKERIQSAIHEMDKPLARSKDDADLVRVQTFSDEVLNVAVTIFKNLSFS